MMGFFFDMIFVYMYVMCLNIYNKFKYVIYCYFFYLFYMFKIMLKLCIVKYLKY